MKFFTALKCTSSLPDDQIEDGDTIVQLGGRAVAFAVAEHLKGIGMDVSNPALDDEHGWAFTASTTGSKYWVLVTDLADEKLIQTKDISPFLNKFFDGKSRYAKILQDLKQSLSGDKRFGNVSWFLYRN
jgi:hypothetical protein